MSRILVIDDEPVLRLTFRHLLEQEGHEVWDAENGRIGVTLCRKTLPDLVITDMIMPEQEGRETVQIIHDEFPQLPVIVMTGGDMPRDLAQCEGCGAVCCVPKPIPSEVLVHLVTDVLAGHYGNDKPCDGQR